jgi:hypothetical protein
MTRSSRARPAIEMQASLAPHGAEREPQGEAPARMTRSGDAARAAAGMAANRTRGQVW